MGHGCIFEQPFCGEAVHAQILRQLTAGQETENQIMEIPAAGFSFEPHRIVSETVSGSIAIVQRKGISRPLDRMEKGDVRDRTKLDRPGRAAMDASGTAADLEETGTRVLCLALEGVDLTSPAGKMTMNVIHVVTRLERDLLVQRTRSDLARAEAAGKPLGRCNI